MGKGWGQGKGGCVRRGEMTFQTDAFFNIISCYINHHRSIHKKTVEWEGGREGGRDRDTERHRQTQREAEIETERQRQRQRETQTERHRRRQTD